MAARMSTNREDEERARLVDLPLEGVVLGTCILRPELIVGADLSTSDFYSEANRNVWRALVGLAADGETIDTVTVIGRLREHGTYEQSGGDDYVVSLTSGLPVTPLPTTRLRKLARERSLKNALVALGRKLGGGDYARELERLEQTRDDLEALDRGKVVDLPEIANTVEALVFDPRRLATGLPTLDAATRGGVKRGSWVVLSGAPGAAKTTFSVSLVDGWERQGAEVLYLAADESLESILVRLGQLSGFDRDALEAPSPDTRNAFAARLRAQGRHVRAIDPGELGVSLEQAGDWLEANAGDRMRVLVVDSIQEVPCEAAALARDELERINAVVNVCKRIARRGTIVVGISEMSRAGYRGNGTDTSALSASKGSGRIEYGAALLCALKPARDVDGAIDIEVAKNRLGNKKPNLRVQLDFARASVSEVAAPDAEEVEAQRTERQASRTRDRVLNAVRRNTDLKSITAVARKAGGRKGEAIAMIRELVEEGTLVVIDKVFRVGGTYDERR